MIVGFRQVGPVQAEANVMKRPINNSPPPVKPDLQQLWYVPDRRIRTPSASANAMNVVAWIQTGLGLDAEPDEHTLFVALHTCAYRAVRCARRKAIPKAERSAWTDRRAIIRGYLVEKNLGLAYSMTGRFATRRLDDNELLSDALLALMRAADRFNPWIGFRFSTYACNVIARALIRRSKLESKYRQRFHVQYDTLCDRPECLPDSHTDLYVERLNRALKTNLGELTDLESNVIARRFSTDRKARLTLKELGDVVGLSKERIRQIQKMALRKLRDALEQDPVLY